MRSKESLLTACLFLTMLSVTANASTLITGVTATASDEYWAPASLTIDGSGLDPAGLHGTDWGTFWLANSTSAGLWIEWTFDQVYELDKMQVWNCPDYWIRGMKYVKIEYSSNSGTTWSTLSPSYYLSPRPDDGNWPHTTPFGYTDEISFGGVSADKVRFTTLAAGPNHGGDTTGLAEVRFFGDISTPPPPARGCIKEGKFGRAVRFQSGAKYWVEASLLPEYVQTPVTIECWVKLDSDTDYNVFLAASLKESPKHWEIYTDSGTGYCSCYLPSKDPQGANSGFDIVNSQWHYLAMVYENNRVRLYVDAVKKADVSLTDTSMPPNNDGPLYFGGYPPDAIGCDGLLDEVRISNIVRSIDQVPTGPFVSDASTIGLWHFDEYTPGVGFDDSSPQNNPARLVPPPANLAMKLDRGVTIDRWYSTIPSQPNFQQSDIQLIKSMGFDYVKLLVNPAPHKSGNTINTSSMWYIDAIVNLVINEGLSAVVTIHPDSTFKTTVLSN
ncbi:hypothetical protein DRP98_09840 [candidate division KSB1 bacterium]|nr:MAG: hypothetical protein DRP98_09840 [candidate division KSB1 bacterium]